MQSVRSRSELPEQRTANNLILALLLTSLLAHLLIFSSVPLVLTTIGVLLAALLVPGSALILALFVETAERPSPFELGLYAVGSGFCIATLVMLGLSYLPGGISASLTLIVFDCLTLILVGLFWWRARAWSTPPAAPAALSAHQLRQWFFVGVLLIVAIGGALRLINLGYAEFHGDEARAVLRASGIIQGYEEVLMLHKKGPGEILMPALQLALGERIDETTARLPFALASIAGLLAIFALGTRLIGVVAGFTAAFLLAFDGYLLAFARFVQYQSVVFLLTTLAILLLYSAYRHPQLLPKALFLASLFFATALLFHYDAAAALIPLAFLWVMIGLHNKVSWARLLRVTVLPAIFGLVCLALFYVPYILHPHFQAALSYLVGSRVGPTGFPHNNIQNVFLRTSLYSSFYYVAAMLTLLATAAYLAWRRGWNAAVAAVTTGIVGLLLLLVVLQPAWLPAENNAYLLMGMGAIFALIWFAPRLGMEERMLWLWLGVPLIGALFFIATPKTHIHVVLAPWALLAGGVIDALARELNARWQREGLLLAGATATLLLTALFGGYAYSLYVQHDPEVLLNWEEAHPSFYWTPFATPESDSLYGFPFTNGWKVVQGLYDEGTISGSFETNQWFEWIPDWYTRGQDRCASTAEWYFAIDNPEPWAQRSAAIAANVQAQGYRPWGVVTVNEQPRMTIYHRGDDRAENSGENASVRTLRLEDFAAQFDATAGPDLPLAYPVVDPVIGQPLNVNFNNEIMLEGYDLNYDGALQPGGNMRLTLYWRALQSNLPAYKVTVQAYDPSGLKAVQKDSYSVCDRLPTSEWPPGELIEDIHDIEIREEIPAGAYPLYIGLYLEETLARLPVIDDAGAVIDDKASLTGLDIVIGE